MRAIHRPMLLAALASLAMTSGCEVGNNARDRFTTTDTISTVTGTGLALGLQAPPELRPGDEGALRLSLTNQTDTVVSNVRLELVVPSWAEPMPPQPGDPPVSMAATTEGTTVFSYNMDALPLQPGQLQTVEQRIRVPSTGIANDSTAPWTRSVRARLLGSDGATLAEVESEIMLDSTLMASVAGMDTITRRDRLGTARLGMTGAALKSATPTARDTSWSQGGATQRGIVVPVGSGRAVAVLEGEAVSRIEVNNPSVRTAEGVGVGSSMDELRAAYGNACADVADGRVVVWFARAPGISFAVDTAVPQNVAQLRDNPGRLAGTARVTRWWLRRGGETCLN